MRRHPNGDPAEWVSSADRLQSPPRWLEGQHTTEMVFRGRGLFYSVAREPEIKPFQLWYPVMGGLPLRPWVQLPPPQHDAPRRRHCSESKRRYPAEIAVCRSLLRLFAGWCQPHFFHISGGVLFRVPLSLYTV